jgi:4-aminobutyrate aminotransferase/(S)-3-amino-2-methylpropionate transaminase
MQENPEQCPRFQADDAPLGARLPTARPEIPGPQSRAWVDRLALRECPAITARRARRAAALGTADDDPIVWAEAVGCNVVDADGQVFVDLCAGFGVASIGHRHPAVVAALKHQADRLLHAMGDAFPDPRRIELMEALCARTGLDRCILGSSGSDAVEAALKTARMASGRDGVLRFEGAYHGLSYGTLAAIGYKAEAFAGPFRAQLGTHTHIAPFGGPIPDLTGIGAVLIEPIQGRGGVRVPPKGWLAELAAAAHHAGAALIFDEIYTGCGRTGTFLRAQTEGVLPDLLCLGKGLAGGFPISACLGTAEVMDAWGASKGEALHTQTFLGNPLGSAMALACLDELDRVIPGVTARGERLRAGLSAAGLHLQGEGLLLGLPLPDTLRASRDLMQRGWIALPAGEKGEVLALTPPLNMPDTLLDALTRVLIEVADLQGALS